MRIAPELTGRAFFPTTVPMDVSCDLARLFIEHIINSDGAILAALFRLTRRMLDSPVNIRPYQRRVIDIRIRVQGRPDPQRVALDVPPDTRIVVPEVVVVLVSASNH